MLAFSMLLFVGFVGAYEIFYSAESTVEPFASMRIERMESADMMSFPACLSPGAYELSCWVIDSGAVLRKAIAGAVLVCPSGDMNGDGLVNAVDVVIIIKYVYRPKS